MPTNRCLRPIPPNKWAVIIDTHTPAAEEPDPDFDPLHVQGRRPLGEPVAYIEASGEGRQQGFTVADLAGNVLGEDTDLSRLAGRLAEGEFDNDFRFEIVTNPEPDDPASMYFVTMFVIPSQQVGESFGTDRPFDAVEAAREAQAFSLEERLGPGGLRFQQEQEAR